MCEGCNIDIFTQLVGEYLWHGIMKYQLWLEP